MQHFMNNKEKMIQNMEDISSDFDYLKVSILEKASRISGEIDRITIGPDSPAYAENLDRTENIENSQNSYNTKPIQNPTHLKNNKVSTHSGITFSVKKILSEGEIQRKERVWKEIERHLQNMKENGRIIQERMAISRSYMAQERERKNAEKLANILAEEERIAEQEEIRRQREQQLHARLAQEQKEKLEREVEEYNKLKEKEDIIKKVVTLRNDAGMKYYDVIMITRACKDASSIAAVYAAYAAKLNELSQEMESIDQKIKTGELESSDIITMENIVQRVESVLSSYRLEIEKINAAYEESISYVAQAVKETVPAEIENQQKSGNPEAVCEVVVPQEDANVSLQTPVDESKEEVAEAEERNMGDVTDVVTIQQSTPVVSESTTITVPSAEQEERTEVYIDQESLQRYVRSTEFLDEYSNSYKDFLQSNTTKKFRFECQKAINIPVNAISSINQQHLRDKYERLRDLLVGKSLPQVGQHPHGAKFCKDMLAKKIISQGEALVSSKPKMAFAIAAVVVALWNDHPDFGELLLAHFYKTCPFIVPIFLPRREDQSNEDYYKLLGYKYSEDGSVEKQDKYLKRISGLMRLYASITVTAQRKGVAKNHPYGLQNAWRWLAAILNTEPRAEVSDIYATLILDMLEVTGNALSAAYPRQFKKLLIVLMEDYYRRMQNSSGIGSGPLVRLEEFLKNALTNGIPQPEGMLSPSFW